MELFETQSEKDEYESAIKDFSAATGMIEISVRRNFIETVAGNNRRFKRFGIDLTGVEGKKERLQYLVKEIKNKFSA
jgi:hypothetical protein